MQVPRCRRGVHCASGAKWRKCEFTLYRYQDFPGLLWLALERVVVTSARNGIANMEVQ